MIYTLIANSNLRLASETAMGLVDSMDLNTPTGEKVTAIMILVYGLMHKYNMSIPDVMQVIDRMESKSGKELIPEFSAAIRYIQGEL